MYFAFGNSNVDLSGLAPHPWDTVSSSPDPSPARPAHGAIGSGHYSISAPPRKLAEIVATREGIAARVGITKIQKEKVLRARSDRAAPLEEPPAAASLARSPALRRSRPGTPIP